MNGPYWSDGPSKSYVTSMTPGWSIFYGKNTDRSTVWSDGPWNKYEPGQIIRSRLFKTSTAIVDDEYNITSTAV